MYNEPRISVPPFLSQLPSPTPCTRQPWLFHPPDDGYSDQGTRSRQRELTAITLCRTCPVMEDCRKWAREQGEFGIWGGETDGERLAAGHPARVRGAMCSARDVPSGAESPRPQRSVGAPQHPSPPIGRRPRLTPVEHAVLHALHEGTEPSDLCAELGRKQGTVMRALLSLQRKLETDTAGLVAVAHSSGLLQAPYGPAA